MAKATSILLISADDAVVEAVQGAVSNLPKVKINSEKTSVAKMNGSAVELAAQNDIVVFATDPDNAEDLTAIQKLNQKRQEGSIFLALTDEDIPLSRARALSDAGADDVLPFPMPQEELGKQLTKWMERIFAAKGGQSGKEGTVIAVAQARGGIGSTTVAVNLADQLLARKGRFRKDAGNKVAIIDLDLQFGAVGDFLDVEPSGGLMQLATGGMMPDMMWVEQSLSTTEGGLDVMTAPTDFVPLDAITGPQIEGLIDAVRRTHDFVVIDMPRAITAWIEPVIAAADQMIMVTDTTVPSIRATHRLIDFFLGDNPGLDVEVVINHEKRPMMQAQHHKEAARVLERKFEHWLPHDAKAARNAVDYGKPLSEVAGRSDLTKAITNLAKATAKKVSSAEQQAAI